MQPSFPRNQRQRPLQKSMFLNPTQPFSNRNNSVQYQYQGLLEMKRSAINIETNKVTNYQLNNQSYQQNQQFTQHNNQVLNFNQTPRHKQSIKIPHFSHINQSNNNIQELNLKQLAEKLDKVTGLVQNHQQMLKNLNFPNFKQKTSLQSQQLIQIQTKLKQNIIPSLINQSTKQIYQHLFNSKFQIQTLKDQIQLINEKYKNQINNWIKEANLMGSKSTSSTILSSDRIEQPVSQLSSSIYSLQNKLFQIQKNIQHKDEYLKSFISSQIQKSKRQSRPSIHSSNIQSTLPPIMLQYQQLFIIKNPISSANKISLIKNRQDNHSTTEILINSNLYQIDKQGCLLDGQNRYIVDQKGAQIRLDQKHIALLRQHHILGN